MSHQNHQLALAKTVSDFDSIRHEASHGAEYWSARELMTLLGYDEWRNFEEKVIVKAQKSCGAYGKVVSDHFVETTKMATIGSGAKREVSDYFLSRYAAYLIAMNGDTTKREIAMAQAYFAVQTRRQELFDQLPYDQQRIRLRQKFSVDFKSLSDAAQDAGVTDFPRFHDQGYRGLYGGMGTKQIAKHKGLSAKQKLLDHMGVTELAANNFRVTQTEERMKREGTQGQDNADRVHFQVGERIRRVILDEGNTPPEKLPLEENIGPKLKRYEREQRRLEDNGGE